LIAEIDQGFRAAVAISEQTPPPSLESIFDDVYQKPPWHLQEQKAELLRGPRAPSAH
jgi:TPP-dependent pyruvate/acetoin dehydrogenase alpha subunit